MTAVDVLGRVGELTDETGSSVDAVMGAAIGPYRKSRLGFVQQTLGAAAGVNRSLFGPAAVAARRSGAHR